MSHNEIVIKVLDQVLLEKPERKKKSEILKALEAQQESLKKAVHSGWSAGALARRLKSAGIQASEATLRAYIQGIVGSPRGRRRRKVETKTL